MPTNPRPEAPDAGAALPTPDRNIRELFDIAIAGDRLARHTGNSFMLSLEKVAAFCRCSRSEAVPILRKIRRAMDEAEAAIEAALADAASPATAPDGSGGRPQAAVTAVVEAVGRYQDAVDRFLAFVPDLVTDDSFQAEEQHYRAEIVEASLSLYGAVKAQEDALASAEADDGWRPIGEAKKDRTPYLLKLKNPIPRDREDLRAWDGLCFVGRHGGITPSGYDMGWQFAAPVGHGGFPDEWFDGFRPIAPPAPASTVGEAGRG